MGDQAQEGCRRGKGNNLQAIASRYNKLYLAKALQAAMNQAAGAGKATSRTLKNSIVAATVGTEHEGKFNAD